MKEGGQTVRVEEFERSEEQPAHGGAGGGSACFGAETQHGGSVGAGERVGDPQAVEQIAQHTFGGARAVGIGDGVDVGGEAARFGQVLVGHGGDGFGCAARQSAGGDIVEGRGFEHECAAGEAVGHGAGSVGDVGDYQIAVGVDDAVDEISEHHGVVGIEAVECGIFGVVVIGQGE